MNRRNLLAGAALTASWPVIGGGAALARPTRIAPPDSPHRGLVVDALAIGGAGSVDGPEVLAAGMDGTEVAR